MTADLNSYAKFLTHLTGRLETELATEIKYAKDCDMIDDPDDETEIVGIDMSIGNWRAAIRNLNVIRDMLNALGELEPAEATR